MPLERIVPSLLTVATPVSLDSQFIIGTVAGVIVTTGVNVSPIVNALPVGEIDMLTALGPGGIILTSVSALPGFAHAETGNPITKNRMMPLKYFIFLI
jgi:hypothetical protein